MFEIASGLLLAFAILLVIPVLIFFIEIVSALALSGKAQAIASNDRSFPVAVLVPARNESVHILPTIADVKAQLRQGDRLIVVADNCSDDTAEVARLAGAEVVVRNDPEKIGKGYALTFGVQHLDANPPTAVLVIDADCRLGDGVIDGLAAECAEASRPTQGLYLMTAREHSKLNHSIAEFAWRIKNWLRPLGLSALRMPCQLMGSGMAFPWSLIRSTHLATGHIADDYQDGLEFAASGHAPRFCPSAVVTSYFATSRTIAYGQRKRWEYGHINIIFKLLPRFFWRALAERNLGLFVLALDMVVPPLTLLALLVIGIFLLTGIAALSGLSLVPFIISFANVTVFGATITLCWLKQGHDLLSIRSIFGLSTFVFEQLKIYFLYFREGGMHHWTTKSDRGPVGTAPHDEAHRLTRRKHP
jgi:cellulose synthase/poly-beta-1,6-N-acetylglucosamine synthase-like glycosyltransferase